MRKQLQRSTMCQSIFLLTTVTTTDIPVKAKDILVKATVIPVNATDVLAKATDILAIATDILQPKRIDFNATE